MSVSQLCHYSESQVSSVRSGIRQPPLFSFKSTSTDEEGVAIPQISASPWLWVGGNLVSLIMMVTF